MKTLCPLKISLFLIFVFILSAKLYSQNNLKKYPETHNTKTNFPGDNPVESVLDVSNITTWVRDNGFHDWKVSSGKWNGNFPNGANAGVIFSEGILWGGLVYDGNSQIVRVNGNIYYSGCKALTRLYRVRSDYKTANLTRDAANYFLKSVEDVTKEDIELLKKQYEKDWNEWPAGEGANFNDINSDGYYDPKVDIPGIPGATQTIFIDYDDSNSIYESEPIGLEITETYWGYSSTGVLGNAVFKKVELVYKGSVNSLPNSHIDSMYINQWADSDLGNFSDDFAGCDTNLNLGYTYNGNNFDNVYSNFLNAPPAVGYDILQGVSSYTGNSNDSAIINLKWRHGYKYVNRKPMSTYIYSSSGGPFADPEYSYLGTLQYFNFLRGKLPNPAYPLGINFPSVYSVTTPFGSYMGPGDPVSGIGIIDGIADGPGDRRLWLITGPFTMNLNDTAEVVIALVVGQGNTNLNSITKLKENDKKIQEYFDRELFSRFRTIDPPVVESISLQNKIMLNWGENSDNFYAVENYSNANYKFEGYEIYQLPSKSSGIQEGVKIANYDLVDGVTAVYDTIRDINSVDIPMLQVSGKDNGISRYIEITRDSLNSTKLFEGQSYYFAVVSYAYNPSPILPYHIIRSPFSVIEAVSQNAKPGYIYNSIFGDTLISIRKGNSDGDLFPIVINPTITDGKTYLISFDTLNNDIAWNMEDKLTGEIILKNQFNQSGDNNYPIVNGIMPKVICPPVGIKSWLSTDGIWIKGHNWGGSQFYGGMDIGNKFWSNADYFYDYIPIELRFTGGLGKENPSVLNGWSQGAVYRKDKDYAYSGIGWMPFTAWDISDSTSPRQINVSFVEDSTIGNTNLIWDLGKNGSGDRYLGGNEYLIISNTSYRPDFYNDSNNAIQKDNMYFIWPIERPYQYSYHSFTISIRPNLINKPGDTFEFTAPDVIEDENLLISDLENINVFPNPYYTFSSKYNINNLGYVTFNHLPNKATIRIFDLSGVIVKTINHESASGQFEKWFLTNDNGNKVSSGIYVVYIDLPATKKVKIIKLAVIQ